MEIVFAVMAIAGIYAWIHDFIKENNPNRKEYMWYVEHGIFCKERDEALSRLNDDDLKK